MLMDIQVVYSSLAIKNSVSVNIFAQSCAFANALLDYVPSWELLAQRGPVFQST